MQEKAKVSLSAFELQLVTDESFILTKNSIIQKVYELFGSLSNDYRSYLQHVPESPAPKISKGENYKGMPYVMLDYPRIFSNNDVLAIRSLFWWGKYFSCTLQLKGIYRERYEQNIIHALQQESFKDFFVSDGVDEWNHDVQHGYTKVKNITTSSITSLPLIKLVAVHPLHEWETADNFFRETVQRYAQLVQDQLPRR
jgi:hypothetical protein